MLLSIPVKPYTAKFLHRHLGAAYKLSRVDLYGRYLYQLLRRPRCDAQYDALMEQYRAEFALSVEPALIFKGGMRSAGQGLSSCMVNDFNQWVESIFFHEFQTAVQLQMALGIRRYRAIQAFCDLHELSEDDISQDTLLSNYKRWVKKEAQKNRNQLATPSALNPRQNG